MKKLALLMFVLSIQASVYSYTWLSFGPDTINASNACFAVGSSFGIICSDEGMYLYDDNNQEWNFYTYGGLPVLGATHLNTNKVLVIMGDGSWSDGIYTFHLETHQFEYIEWIPNPNFLKYNELSGTWYAGFNNLGTLFSGLFKSTDGLNWNGISFFDEIPCSYMDFFEDHFVISSISKIFNIYWSDDSGNTWNQSPAGVPFISDMKFNNEGLLYGIFPNGSNSSGLWRSVDYGNSWEVEFWSDNMSAVGFDAFGRIFVGWESPNSGNEGIAIYDPDAPPPGLTFLNEGLPNININKILLNPTMSAPAIFCCTDAGVYMSYDYMVGESERYPEKNEFDIFPNPARDYIDIRYSTVLKGDRNVNVQILNCNGQIIDEFKIPSNVQEKNKIRMDTKGLDPGFYYLLIKSQKETRTKKFIIH